MVGQVEIPKITGANAGGPAWLRLSFGFKNMSTSESKPTLEDLVGKTVLIGISEVSQGLKPLMDTN
jgi:hypothetical protein